MPAPIDLTGQQFGMLTVVWTARDRSRGRAWDCWCQCGHWVPAVPAKSLRSGNTSSCGCKRKSSIAKARWPNGRKPPCRICGRQHFASGFCKVHHAQWVRRGKPDATEWAAMVKDGREYTCVICGRPFTGYKKKSCDRKSCLQELGRRNTRECKARIAAIEAVKTFDELQRRLGDESAG